MPIPVPAVAKLIAAAIRKEFPESAELHNDVVHQKLAKAIMDGVGPYVEQHVLELKALILALEARIP
jgi:hypothetical protein